MKNSDRIAKLFAQKKKEGLSVFIGYVCACDPDFENSLSICKSLLANGVDLLELGVPFSDPLADGKTNQLAAQRALDAGCLQEDVFRLVKAIREFSEAPIVFYTYYNLVFSQGVETYVDKSIEAGVDGLLTLDLPPEEADDLVAASRERGMKNIFIVAPTTPEERIPLIAASASGFLYYVSREGVTGEREDLAGDLADRVATIRRHADLPVVVGFGISNSKQVRAIGEIADGVVVGSALVNCILQNIESLEQIPAKIGDKARELAQGLQPLSG